LSHVIKSLFSKNTLIVYYYKHDSTSGFVLNRENQYDPYNTELVETKTGTLAPSSKITSLPLDAGLDAIEKIIESNQNRPEFLGLNYRKATDRLGKCFFFIIGNKKNSR
jgi:hypothetical protein